MLLKILLVLFVLACLAWLVTILVPATRENGTHLILVCVICLINLFIQVAVCMN